MSSNSADVILIGASVRALSSAARIAGLKPICVDLFRDADLAAHHPDALICPWQQYPHGFIQICAQLPALPIIYTGGFENYPDVIAELNKRHVVWGNTPDVLQQVREHQHTATRREPYFSWCVPERSNTLPDDHRTWLVKSRRSSAGRNVSVAGQHTKLGAVQYFQELIPGVPMSLQAVSTHDGHHALAVMEQLIGCEWLNAKPFWYCGNIGPLTVPSEMTHWLNKTLRYLCPPAMMMSGLFGIDYIANDAGNWFLEINPRPTAAMELLERHCGYSYLTAHLNAYRQQEIQPFRIHQAEPIMGKAIWHTPFACRTNYDPKSLPEGVFADLPHSQQEFGENEPFVTMFAKGLDREAVVLKLQKIAASIPHRFGLQEI